LFTSGPIFKIAAYNVIFDGKKFSNVYVFIDRPSGMKSVSAVGVNVQNGMFYAIGAYRDELFLYTNSKAQKANLEPISNFDVAVADVMDGFIFKQEKTSGEVVLISDSGNVMFVGYTLMLDELYDPLSGVKRFQITRVRGVNLDCPLFYGRKISNDEAYFSKFVFYNLFTTMMHSLQRWYLQQCNVIHEFNNITLVHEIWRSTEYFTPINRTHERLYDHQRHSFFELYHGSEC
jgi:hypothetical protein